MSHKCNQGILCLASTTLCQKKILTIMQIQSKTICPLIRTKLNHTAKHLCRFHLYGLQKAILVGVLFECPKTMEASISQTVYYTNNYAQSTGQLPFKQCAVDEVRIVFADHIMITQSYYVLRFLHRNNFFY